MKSFRGQAALEFMMTYGWAILVVLAAIGALSYFGVLDPSRFTPDTCMASSGFSCDGRPVAYDGNITFTVSNGAGYNIALDNNNAVIRNANCVNPTTNVRFCTRGVADPTCNETFDFIDGSTTTIFIDGCNNTGLNIAKGELEITYQNAKSGLPESVIFTFVAKPK